MIKKYKIISIVITILFTTVIISGCSSSNQSTPPSPPAAPEEEYFPDVDRSKLVEPVSQTPTGTSGTSSPSTETSSTNLKIGSTTTVKSGRYELEGVVKITGTTSVDLNNFSYNGTCSDFNLYMTRSNNPTVIVVPFNMANRIYNNESFSFNFPTGVTINDIDAVAMTCETGGDPVFTITLQ